MAIIGIVLILILAAAGFAIPIAIGLYVYRDAQRRDMNAVLWTAIVILTPGLVGLIIYLVARSDTSSEHCGNCGNRVSASFALCPYCGTNLRPTCANCGHPIESGWIVCPNCGDRLPDSGIGTVYETRTRDRGLSAILIGVIVIPIVLIIVIALVAFGMIGQRVNVEEGVVVDESVEIEADLTAVIKMTVNVSDDIDNIYEAVMYLGANGNIVTSEAVWSVDSGGFIGEKIFFFFEHYGQRVDSFYIEFLAEDGDVVYLSDLYAIDDYPEEISLIIKDGEITEHVE